MKKLLGGHGWPAGLADNKQTKNTKEAKVCCLKREYTSKQGQIREGKEERRRKGKKKEEGGKKKQ